MLMSYNTNKMKILVDAWVQYSTDESKRSLTETKLITPLALDPKPSRDAISLSNTRMFQFQWDITNRKKHLINEFATLYA